MTRMPSLWSLLTGIDLPPVDPREQARQDYEAAVRAGDTRRQAETWKALFAATTQELAGRGR